MPNSENPIPCNERMPAEWEAHEATWIAWPHQRDDWPGKFGPIPWVFAEIVRHLHRCERVPILLHDPRTKREARRTLTQAGVDLGRIDFVRCPTDRGWLRDSAGIFVKDASGNLTLTNWGFNAWAKYDNWTLDDRTPDVIAKHLGLRTREPQLDGRRVVLEGGAIDVNGEGLLLTTEECLLGDVQQRNPGMTRRDYEHVFMEHLGVQKVLWLNRGIAGDDTHGHVDDLARFVGPRTVVIVTEDDSGDANYESLRENWRRLTETTDLDGRPLEVVALPMPEPVFFDGQRLPASYVNFYIANDRVLVPTFNDPNDRRALNILAEQFPGRTVVGIHAVDLVLGLGTLHCLTQQQPRGVRSPSEPRP